MTMTDNFGAIEMIKGSKLSQHTKRELMGTMLLDAHVLIIELGMGDKTERKNLLRIVNVNTMANLVGWKQLFLLFKMHYPTLAKLSIQKDPITNRLKIRKMRKIDMAFLIALDINEGYSMKSSPLILRMNKKTEEWYSKIIDNISKRGPKNNGKVKLLTK